MTETRIVCAVSAHRTLSGLTRPAASTGSNINSNPCDALTGSRVLDFQDGALLAEIVDHSQDTQAAAVVQAVRDKIHGPMLVDPPRPVQLTVLIGLDLWFQASFFLALKPDVITFCGGFLFGAAGAGTAAELAALPVGPTMASFYLSAFLIARGSNLIKADKADLKSLA